MAGDAGCSETAHCVVWTRTGSSACARAVWWIYGVAAELRGSAAGKKQQEVGVDYRKELGGEPPLLLLLGFNAGRTGARACLLVRHLMSVGARAAGKGKLLCVRLCCCFD